jgi:hypothetical protein
VVSYPQVSPPKPCIRLSSRHTCYMPHPSRSSASDCKESTLYLLNGILCWCSSCTVRKPVHCESVPDVAVGPPTFCSHFCEPEDSHETLFRKKSIALEAKGCRISCPRSLGVFGFDR